MGTVTISLIKNKGTLFSLFLIKLLLTVPIILDQAVVYCSHYFGSGCWLMFPLFFIWLLVNVPVIFDQSVCWLLLQ
jgi:hypothetical protein